MATQYKILVGDTDTPEIRVPTTGDDSYLAPVTLDAATGNEVAFDIQYTVNKATSGDDTGLLVNQTDTAVPGQSWLIDAQTNGTSVFKIAAFAGQIMLYNGTFASRFTRGDSSIMNLCESTGWQGVRFAVGGTLTGDPYHFTTDSISLTASSGTQNFLKIEPTYNQSGTAGGTDLLINRTETAVGSGAQLLADFQVGGISKAQISKLGNVSGTIVTSSNYVGTTSAVGATSGFGVYISRDDIRMRSGTTLGWVASASDAFDTEDTLLSRAGISQLQTSHATNAETSGTFGAFQINQTYNQASGTAANTDLLINRTETAVGSGAQLLADFQVGGSSLLNIDNGGKITCDPGGTFGTGTGIWFGDGDTGWAETADDELALYRAGTAVFQIVGIGTVGSPNSGGYALYNQAAAATVPTFAPNRGDSNTGIGSAGADQLSLIAGGVEGMRISETGGITQVEIAQGTNDAPFIDFQATADADATSAISTLTTSGATSGHIQVEVNGVKAWIAYSTTNPT